MAGRCLQLSVIGLQSRQVVDSRHSVCCRMLAFCHCKTAACAARQVWHGGFSQMTHRCLVAAAVGMPAAAPERAANTRAKSSIGGKTHQIVTPWKNTAM